MTGAPAHDGKAFRIVKKPNFINTKTIKTVESFREHFLLHRGDKATRRDAKVFESEKKEETSHILDKAALLVPTANLSYNFFARKVVRDFLTELCNYRLKTSHQALLALLDKMGNSQGKHLMKRLDKLTADYKSVSCSINEYVRFSESVFQFDFLIRF